MTDSHRLIEEWLADGAVGDPPRELAVHASVCESCARRLGAFDSLATIDVNAAGSPPPLAPPTRVAVWLAWARLTTAVAGTVVAGILVVFGATQFVGLVGFLDGNPGPSDLAGLATPLGSEDSDGTPGPDPAVEPSLVAEPSGTPIPSFIPLPSQAPNEPPPAPPNAPSLYLNSVGQNSIGIGWTPSGGGGPVQKWEVWRQTGSGGWIKLGEVLPSVQALTNSGLASGTTYSFRVRGDNTEWLGPFSNVISATTTSPPPTPPPPTPAPTPIPTPEPTPSPMACENGADDDGDGTTDLADPGCSGPSDNDEHSTVMCDNGSDDDGDATIDLGDPGCSDLTDDDEHSTVACDNGSDDDGDALTDYPADPGCDSLVDPDEVDPSPSILPLGPLLPILVYLGLRNRRRVSTPWGVR